MKLRNEYDANWQLVRTPDVPLWMRPAPRRHTLRAPRGLFDRLLSLVGLL